MLPRGRSARQKRQHLRHQFIFFFSYSWSCFNIRVRVPEQRDRYLGRGTPYDFNLTPGAAVDGAGNFFVGGSSDVLEVFAPNYNAFTTIAAGSNNPSGLAFDTYGNLFVADTGNNAVKELLAAGGYVTVNPVGSGFSAPMGVAVDASGNIFVADTGNNAVKEILAEARGAILGRFQLVRRRRRRRRMSSGSPRGGRLRRRRC